jgi:hypothetical protein
MDIFSHSLWTGAIYRKDKKIWWPIFFSVAPDIFSNGIFVVLSIIKGVSFIDGSREHLNPIKPDWIPVLYSIAHSLVFFAIVFLIVWLILKKPWWPLAAWGIHIVADIPFHSTQFSATPFLFPISSFKVDSISWSEDSFVLIINFCLLAIIYLGFYVLKNKKKRFGTYFNEKRKLKKR